MRRGFPYIEGIPLDMALIFLHMVPLQRLRAYDFCSAYFLILLDLVLEGLFNDAI